VTRIIFDELAQNQVRPESGVAMRGVIDRLCRAGAEGVVLGCTELGLLPFDESGGPPLFDTTEIHVEAIVEHMLEGPE